MPSRRSHTNSHHGCSQCKAGRVKCDELKPHCSRCQKKNISCTYRHLQSDHDPFRSTSISKRNHSHGRSSSVTDQSVSKSPERSNTTHRSSKPVLSKQTEGLFNHYLQVVSPFFIACADLELPPLWDEGIRRYAADHNHLYSITLAFAAAHLAVNADHECDRKHFLALALEHQTEALTLFRPALGDLSAINSDAAFVTAAMIVMCAMIMPVAARKVHPEHHYDAVQELTLAFALFEGTTQLFGTSLGEEHSIRVHVRIRIFQYRENEADCPEADAALDQLAEYVKEHEGVLANALYSNAIMHLKNIFRRLEAMPNNQSVVLLWPSVIWHSLLMQRLQNREPLALVMVAYWAVSLHKVREQFWIGDWGSWALQAIYDVLDPKWRRFLDWPLQEVGLRSAQGQMPLRTMISDFEST